MRKHFSFLLAFFMAASAMCSAQVSMEALPEFLRPNPFGGIVAADQAGSKFRSILYDADHQVVLKGWRGGYISFQLVVKSPTPASYSLKVSVRDPAHKIQTDLFREWFHFVDSSKQYFPDALVPVHGLYRSRLPDPDNKIANQSAQGFWVDVYVPADARPGVVSGRATLKSGKTTIVLPLRVTVLKRTIPTKDVITVDHNSYGSEFLEALYPAAYRKNKEDWDASDQFFDLIHAYHRIFYEHRGTFHELAYGHAGKVDPDFAPVLAGTGRNLHIANWTLFDRLYGPLLDGSAFASTRRGPRPIPYMYLPINPEWPASYEFWGEPGYKAEFVNVVSEMERHFREKGWTHTTYEVFFNQKKRYKGFPWDGDEMRFPKDMKYFADYGRFLKAALPPNSPVHIVMRADVSWDMEQQFKELKGIVKFWNASGGILSFYRYAPEMLHKRGDIVWYYGGTPSVTQNSTAITESLLRAWLWGVDGYSAWDTVDPGADPWFHSDGESLALVYSGERFGITGPIPSIRLKIQRNALQDLDILDSFKDRIPLQTLRSAAARHFNNSVLDDWWNPRPALADKPSDQWQGDDIDAAQQHAKKSLPHPTVYAWYNVHRYVLKLAGDAK